MKQQILKLVMAMQVALLSLNANAQAVKIDGKTICPDNNHPHAIDLGLPSGIKWACCNVGAKSPKEYGNYYAWSETEPKEEYNWKNYKYCIAWDGSSAWNWDKYSDHFYFTKYVTNDYYGEIDNKVTLDLEDDAAHVVQGKPWRMPTSEEMQELVDKCQWKWTTSNGMNGYLITGANGNSIFLPAAGSYNFGSELSNQYSEGFYYTSSLYKPHCKGALYLYFNTEERSVTIFDSYFDRRDGRTIRGICKTVVTHTHNYERKWNYNESTHWHACVSTEGTCNAPKGEEASHVYGTKGKSLYTCTVCGYVDESRKPHEEEHFDIICTTDDIGRIIGANGKIYDTVADAEADGTIASGIIAYVGEPGSADDSSPVYSGLALSLTDATDSGEEQIYAGGMVYYWYTERFSNCVPLHTLPDAEKVLIYDGIYRTNMLTCKIDGTICKDENHVHPAAIAAANYPTVRPSNTSEWFLPSIGQWDIMVKALVIKAGGTATDMTGGFYKNMLSNVFASLMKDAGADELYPSLAGAYWSSTPSSTDGYYSAWAMGYEGGRGGVCGDYLNTYLYVRPCFAFEVKSTNAIGNTSDTSKNESIVERYDLDGRKIIGEPIQKGVNIIRYSDGQKKKVYVK